MSGNSLYKYQKLFLAAEKVLWYLRLWTPSSKNDPLLYGNIGTNSLSALPAVTTKCCKHWNAHCWLPADKHWINRANRRLGLIEVEKKSGVLSWLKDGCGLLICCNFFFKAMMMKAAESARSKSILKIYIAFLTLGSHLRWVCIMVLWMIPWEWFKM